MERTSRVSMAALPQNPELRHGDGASCLAAPDRRRVPVHMVPADAGPNADHFVERDGMRFAGTHLIVDLWQASGLDDTDLVEAALRDAAMAAGATLLNIDLHRFTPSGGITGVATLAESHISIHTWPERAYAAIDVFMCGDAEPHESVGVLRKAFRPLTLTISEHRRGVMP